MGILDPLFSLRQFTCRSFFGFQEKREKESASGDSLLSFQRSPRVYNNYFCYYGFFFSWNPWGNLCLGERESYVHYFVFLYTWFNSIMKRSCCADGGVAGESRLHSELFSTNQGYRYTKLHNRNKRQWNIEITCCSFWTWRTWGSQW